MSLLLRTLNGADRQALQNRSVSEIVMRGFWEASAGGTKKIISDAEVYLQDWDIDLQRISCPVQFWHGENDQNIPVRMARHLAEMVPGASFNLVPEEGHFSLCTNRGREILLSMRKFDED